MAALLGLVEPGLVELVVRVEGGGAAPFPLVEAVTEVGRSGGLEELTLEMELRSNHLSLVASSLTRCTCTPAPAPAPLHPQMQLSAYPAAPPLAPRCPRLPAAGTAGVWCTCTCTVPVAAPSGGWGEAHQPPPKNH